MPRIPSRLVLTPYGVYTFRLALPAHLAAIIGKREVWRSLYTKDAKQANFMAYSLNLMVMSMNTKSDFEKLEALLRGLNPQANQALNHMTGKSRNSPVDGTLVVEGFQAGAFSANKIIVDNTSDEAAQRDTRALHDMITAANRLHIAPASVTQAMGPSPDHNPADHNSMTLTDAIYRYGTNLAGQHSIATRKDYGTVLARFREFIGAKTLVADITGKTLDNYLGLLQFLPTNYEKRKAKEFGNIPAKAYALKLQKSGLPPTDALSAQTIKQQQRVLSAFFAWLIDSHNYHGHNPCDGLVKLTKAAKMKLDTARGQQPFSTDELTRIFSPATYLLFTKGKADNHFAPLIGLFTGARLNEIMQARVEDFWEGDGRYYLNVTLDLSDDEAQQTSVKNINSIRTLPIHDKIIAMGFASYVQQRRDAKHNRIFDAPRDGKGKFTKNLSRDFNDYLCHIGIKKAGSRTKTMHSLRVTFIQSLQAQGVDGDTRRALSGHAAVDVHESHYMGKAHAPGLSQVIHQHLEFPFIDVATLKFP